MEGLFITSPETPEPIPGEIKGQIPLWINGSMYRNGPGIFEVGDSQYNHWFDGLALLHKFDISNGKVEYRSKYIKSEAYEKNMAANRIVISEYGTMAYPDPCKNIFQRMLTWFQSPPLTDNTVVTVTPCSPYVFTSTETNLIHKVDPTTLDTVSGHSIDQFMVVDVATAHILREPDGTMHNVGKSYKGTPKYSFVKIPVPEDGKDVYDKAEVVGSVPFRWSKNPTYLHSFGLSENYYVLVEQALAVSVLGLMASRVTRKTYSECLKWHASEKNRFRIVDRRTGQEVSPKTPYVTDPFFMFHHVNTYEEQGHLVVDVSAYPDKNIMDRFYLKNLRSEHRDVYPEPTIRRYVLPLATCSTATSGQNLVTLKESSASAVKQKNGQILCHYEKLSDQGLDFPHINDGRLGKKYRYIYGAGGEYIHKLVKIDTMTKQSWVWEEEGTYVAEPVFIPGPGATDEDDGALVSVLYKMTKPRHVTCLLVLDARTMTELGRAQFDVSLARDIHACFVQS